MLPQSHAPLTAAAPYDPSRTWLDGLANERDRLEQILVTSGESQADLGFVDDVHQLPDNLRAPAPDNRRNT